MKLFAIVARREPDGDYDDYSRGWNDALAELEGALRSHASLMDVIEQAAREQNPDAKIERGKL